MNTSDGEMGEQSNNQRGSDMEDGELLGEISSVTSGGMKVRLYPETVRDVKLAASSRIGHTIKTPVENAWVFATIRSMEEGRDNSVELEVEYNGQSNAGKFTRGVTFYPFPGAKVYQATLENLSNIYAPQLSDSFRIGTIVPTEDIPASLLIEPFLSKHFAILGSTGTGKSCTVALTLHSIVKQLPNAHIVVLDPHNEYADAFPDNGVHFNTENLDLPYWLMNLNEHYELFISRESEGRDAQQDVLKRCLLEARKKSHTGIYKSRITVDTPVPYKISDMMAALDAEGGKLDKAEDAKPFMKLRAKYEELRSDQRYAFMFSGLLVQDSLASVLSRILRFPVSGRPISTLDLSGVPSDIVDVVVALLSRLVFDYSMVSHKASEARPVLLIAEEAHRYAPSHGLESRGSARKQLEQIAKEGRKYGVSLGLVSQRPSDISESVLSQCGTIITMRMNNERDRSYVEKALPEGSAAFLDALPALQNRECIVSGEGTSAPVRVKLDYLDENLRPKSEDPEFAGGWRHDIDINNEIVKQTITNWRWGKKKSDGTF